MPGISRVTISNRDCLSIAVKEGVGAGVESRMKHLFAGLWIDKNLNFCNFFPFNYMNFHLQWRYIDVYLEIWTNYDCDTNKDNSIYIIISSGTNNAAFSTFKNVLCFMRKTQLMTLPFLKISFLSLIVIFPQIKSNILIRGEYTI